MSFPLRARFSSSHNLPPNAACKLKILQGFAGVNGLAVTVRSVRIDAPDDTLC
jgi:hypothetical protein